MLWEKSARFTQYLTKPALTKWLFLLTILNLMRMGDLVGCPPIGLERRPDREERDDLRMASVGTQSGANAVGYVQDDTGAAPVFWPASNHAIQALPLPAGQTTYVTARFINEAGQITLFKVMIRPLKGLNAVLTAMGEQLNSA